MAENDAVIVPSAAPNNAATEPVKTPSAPTATEPTTLETPLLTHNARTSEAFLNIGGVANLQETVESLSKDIPLERRGEFFDLVGGLVYRSTDAFKRADEMEKRNKTFAEQRKTMEEYNKDLAKHLISVMVDLYENYNAGSTPVTDNLKKAAEKSLAENPMLLEFAKPITVCASAIRNRIEEHQRKQSDAMKKLERQCEAANDRIKEYTQLFGDLPKMIKTPIFETPAAEPVAPSAAPVVVCASQNQKKRARLIPDWLQQHCEEAGKYETNAFTSNRMFKDQLPTSYTRG